MRVTPTEMRRRSVRRDGWSVMHGAAMVRIQRVKVVSVEKMVRRRGRKSQGKSQKCVQSTSVNFACRIAQRTACLHVVGGEGGRGREEGRRRGGGEERCKMRW